MLNGEQSGVNAGNFVKHCVPERLVVSVIRIVAGIVGPVYCDFMSLRWGGDVVDLR